MPDDMNSRPRTMTVMGFVDDFKRINDEMKNRRFAFILGAGASKGSGIKLAHEMVAEWVRILHRRSQEHSFVEEADWATAENLGILSYARENPAASYAQLYQRMYAGDAESGFAYLEKQMVAAEPSYGYSVLGRILDGNRHNTVITVNFDNLVADALSIYSTTYPLVCGHESLAQFAGTELRRPLIMKVHRDLLLSPRSTAEELEKLPAQFSEAIKNILRRYTPIVIGYGANDASLMGCLNSLDHQLPGGVYWCYQEGRELPRQEIQDFVAKQHGYLVPIPGFDELFLLLGQALGIGNPKEELLLRAQQRAEKLDKQLSELEKNVSQRASRPNPGTLSASKVRRHSKTETSDGTAPATVTSEDGGKAAELDAVMHAIESARGQESVDKGWWQWQREAASEPNPDMRDAIYHEALQALPESLELMNNYANFLTDVRKDHDQAERFYLHAIEKDSKDADYLCNYATFLTDVRKDHDQAENFYLRSIEADPTHANILGSYAVFLTDVRKDHDQARKFYLRAIEADPADANNFANYARLLLGSGRINEGLAQLDAAFAAMGAHCFLQLAAECWMYAYCCRPAAARAEALSQLMKLIIEHHVTTGEWDFSGVIKQATKMDHPEASWLPKLAEVLARDADPSILEAWQAWREADAART